MSTSQQSAGRLGPPSSRRARTPQRRARVRPERVVILACCLVVAVSFVSWVSAMLQPSSTGLGIQTVEWLRDNGARGIVNQIEDIYYTWQAPSTGGPALRRLPGQTGTQVPNTRLHVDTSLEYRPAPIKPLIHPALAGEGVWRSTFAEHGQTTPPVLITSFRSDPAYPQMVAGVAWINHRVTSTWLYPGMQEPSVSMPSRGPEEVPSSMRQQLVATFNSGFKLVDSGGGFAWDGHTDAPMKRGLATLVRYTDGRVDVISWTGGSRIGSNVVYARQNLPLIVNAGKPNPNLSSGPEWGATLGNAVRVWRSAVGVDARGNLIYAAADYQTVGSLAAIMIRAGAVRAMEMDINAEWPSFITYRAPGAVGAANLLSGMAQSPQRYLTPDDRDFFAVYLR